MSEEVKLSSKGDLGLILSVTPNLVNLESIACKALMELWRRALSQRATRKYSTKAVQAEWRCSLKRELQENPAMVSLIPLSKNLHSLGC